MSPARQIIHVPLRPSAGTRFQPTGFPDIGAATFRRPSDANGGAWERALLVESAQSMANHLEAVGWDRGPQQPVETIAGLPYVRVVNGEGTFLTSSRTEAHRLASAFVKDSTWNGRDMTEEIRDRLGLRDDMPLAPQAIARAVMELDPLCLLHGVFFAESAEVWPGQPRIPRAVTAFIEANDVEEAVSGGVKRDDVRHSTGEKGGSQEGYGTIPYHRLEWTARKIVASFVIDLIQLESYGLPEPGAALLGAIARWEIRAFLDHGLRLRTACDLVPVGEIDLPQLGAAAAEVRRLIGEAAPLLGVGGAIDVVWSGGKKGRRKRTSKVEEAAEASGA